jgi:hypothetical protein
MSHISRSFITWTPFLTNINNSSTVLSAPLPSSPPPRSCAH